MKVHAFRLLPGEDLKGGIENVLVDLDIRAGWVVSAVGSLKQINIRFANKDTGFVSPGSFEIVSLSGTLSVNGCHLHISVADSNGQTTGGHLLHDNIVFTTAEIIIGYEETMEFTREQDGTTEWAELQIKRIG
jgi:uncharacterized protein